MYGGAGSERCPGEEHCDLFRRAKGKTREEKEQNACVLPKCPKFGSKPKFAIEDDDSEIIDRIERIRDEQRAGLVPDIRQMTALEWELLVYWHRVEASHERQYQATVVSIATALLK